MLLVITPNPALDRTMVISGLRPGGIHRTDQVVVAPGGKGLNVARAARALGQPVRVCGPLGGMTGDIVARLAEAEGLDCQWHWHSAGETRTCVLLVDPKASDGTALNEAGPTFSADDWQTFVAVAHAAASDASMIAISGSLPPGVPPAALTSLISDMSAASRRVIVDCSGPALVAALEARPFAVKVNQTELATALQQPVKTHHQVASALSTLRWRGISLAAVSLGAEGAMAANDEGTFLAHPPAAQIVSSIGSGDSLLAGLATGLLRGLGLADALRLGVACGTADALTIGGGLFTLPDVERLVEQTNVRSW